MEYGFTSIGTQILTQVVGVAAIQVVMVAEIKVRYDKSLKRENLQLAFFSSLNILANYKFPP